MMQRRAPPGRPHDVTADRRRRRLAAGALIWGALIRRRPRQRGEPAPDHIRLRERGVDPRRLIREEHNHRQGPTLDQRWPRWRFWSAVFAGLIGVLPLLLLTEVFYFRFHDVPREQAVVVSQTAWTAGPRDCRAFARQVIVTFRADHPRPGFPAEFSRLECRPLDEKVGEVVTVARKDTTAWPRVDVGPVQNQVYALLFPLAMGVVFSAVMYGALWIVSRLSAALRA